VQDAAEYTTCMCAKDCIAEGQEKPIVDVTPGDGEVDFATVIGTLRKAGMAGPVMIETLGGETANDRVREAKRAVEFLTPLLA